MDSEVIGPLAGAVLGFLGGQLNGRREAKSKRESLEADLEQAEKAAAVQVQQEKDELKANLAQAIEEVVSGIQADLLSADVESKARGAMSAAKGSSKFDEDSNVKGAAHKLGEALTDTSAKREAKAVEARELLNA